MHEYVRVRAQQLRQEADKCGDAHDRAWYYKCAQELEWVLDLIQRNNEKEKTQKHS